MVTQIGLIRFTDYSAEQKEALRERAKLRFGELERFACRSNREGLNDWTCTGDFWR